MSSKGEGPRNKHAESLFCGVLAARKDSEGMEDEVATQASEHHCLEPHACLRQQDTRVCKVHKYT